MMHETIEYTVEEGVATIRLNRPQTLNSFNTQMHRELREAMAVVRNDRAVRCLLISANGRGFCAGQDLNDRAVEPGAEPVDLGDSVEQNYNPLVRAITTLEKPVVCAVNGVAAGAGASVALACDIVLAARSASFVQAFAKIGVVPDSGGTWHLPRALGLPRAKALAMLGEKLSAEKAEQWGLIWRCVEDAELMPEALRLARHLAAQPTRALARIKQAMQASFSNTLHEQLEMEKAFMRELGNSHDYREGVAAFREKRKPEFRGE
ncbi:MAG: 2-(1,2-epoxy-1,2-dihydrophenyl)acetyl-CoA isomerase PaaG [Gammaproteobacteria bacterium]